MYLIKLCTQHLSFFAGPQASVPLTLVGRYWSSLLVLQRHHLGHQRQAFSPQASVQLTSIGSSSYPFNLSQFVKISWFWQVASIGPPWSSSVITMVTNSCFHFPLKLLVSWSSSLGVLLISCFVDIFLHEMGSLS